ncbi:ThiF family adenylyltransferase [Maribacter sp. 2304DJ31-5]|uniref:ThiF family adenylyltransferase n=1 Tax=Maribacter sp. 2304DJ31-5 TaxID=3386273 RepID=UPI0039BD26E0
MITQEEQIQYSRHLQLDAIGYEGQKQLKNARVLVIGAGGLGCPILQYLVAAGVGHIGIVDDDIVQRSNLQRQVLFTYSDIGEHKASVAKKRMELLNPFIKIEAYITRLSPENAKELFEAYDIIVDGTDNFPSRYLINDAACLYAKPVVYGSIYKFEGQVSVFNYQNGPTYRCLFPKRPKIGSMPNCSEIGVMGVLPGIIGCLQANEIIKIICKLNGVLSGKLLTFDSISLSQNILHFDKTENANIIELQNSYEATCTISDKIKEIEAHQLEQLKTSHTLLDVRTALERQEFHIGGLHIPLDKLEHRISEIPLNQPIIVYCQSGIRSQKAIEKMLELGFATPLFNLKNGIVKLICFKEGYTGLNN